MPGAWAPASDGGGGAGDPGAEGGLKGVISAFQRESAEVTSYRTSPSDFYLIFVSWVASEPTEPRCVTTGPPREKDLPWLEAGLRVDLAIPRDLERLPATKARDGAINRLRRRTEFLRVGVEIGRIFNFAIKAGYCPSQPRDERGTWSGGSGGCPKEGSDGALVQNPNAPQRHHIVPKGMTKQFPDLPPETRRYFNERLTPPLAPRSHAFDSGHQAYNQAVKQAFQDYMARNNLRSRDVSLEHARAFADSLYRHPDSRISGYLRLLPRQSAIWRSRRGRGLE
jgi:hypothetical protein